MPKSKKIGHSDIIGQRGIALIHSIVTKMGFLWHPTGLEAGIDGLIEIRNSETSEVTNLVVQVQSKAREKPFDAETLETFDYLCKDRDLYYWLRGNAPVILVVSRVDTGEAYWVSIKDYFNDPQIKQTRKVRFNKEHDKFDDSAKDALIALAMPGDVSLYFEPQKKHERLYSNLLSVSILPESFYEAKTDYADERQLYRALKLIDEFAPEEWIVKNNILYSFHNLEGHPWNTVCDADTAFPHDTDEWACSDDIVKKRYFVELLNLCLRQTIQKLDLIYNEEFDFYYFAPTEDLSTRAIPYPSFSRNTSRDVFKGYGKRIDGTYTYYRHSAFKGHFIRCDYKWYLEITPTYHYTSDGYHLYKNYEALLKGIKREEKNAAVLGQLVAWTFILRGNQSLISDDSSFLRFSGLQAFDVEVGLDDRNWIKKEDDKAKKPKDEDTELLQAPLLFDL